MGCSLGLQFTGIPHSSRRTAEPCWSTWDGMRRSGPELLMRLSYRPSGVIAPKMAVTTARQALRGGLAAEHGG